MDNTQKRRQELLDQTRRIYSDKHKIPAVHPRYGNFTGENGLKVAKDKDFTLKSLKLRIFVSLILFVIYAALDYSGAIIGTHSGDTVAEIISETIDIQEVWNSW